MKYIFVVVLMGLLTAMRAAEPVKIVDAIGNEPLLRRAVMTLALKEDGGVYRIKNTEFVPAAKALKDGQAEFVICSSDDLPQLRKEVPSLTAEPYAIEVLGIAVNSGNEVKDMPLAELRKIFGGPTISWRDYNGTGFMIHKIAPGKHAVGKQVFYHKLLQGKEVAKDVALSENAAEPLIMATGNRNALACGVWNLRPMLEARFLTVDGIEPTPENVKSGKYPLAVTYYICSTRPIPGKLLQALRDDKNLESLNLISVQ